MREVDAADARGRRHRERLGEREPGVLRAEEREQLRLLAVVGAGRIAERGPDPAEALREQLLRRELRAGLVPRAARGLVEVLGERLGEAVGERLDHDRVVVVVLGREARGELVGADPGGDGERADVIAVGRDVVGERAVRPRVAVVRLLAEEAEARVADDDVVSLRVRRPEAEHALALVTTRH